MIWWIFYGVMIESEIETVKDSHDQSARGDLFFFWTDEIQ